MTNPNDNPPDPQPAAGRDAIDARRSQGFVNRAGTVNQHFYGDAAAERLIPTCSPPLAGQLIGRDEIVSELIGQLTGAAEVVAICAAGCGGMREDPQRGTHKGYIGQSDLWNSAPPPAPPPIIIAGAAYRPSIIIAGMA